MNQAEERNEDMVAIHRMVVLIDEQAPPVPADEEDEDTVEDTVQLAPYEIARLLDEVAIEVVPWVVAEEHGV